MGFDRVRCLLAIWELGNAYGLSSEMETGKKKGARKEEERGKLGHSEAGRGWWGGAGCLLVLMTSCTN